MTVVTNPCSMAAVTVNASPATSIPASSPTACPIPHGPPRGTTSESLYDDEKTSDLTIVAGLAGDTWRFPGHRQVLLDAGPVFRALLSTHSNIVIVDYVDKKAFEQLMRHAYREPVQIASAATARATLHAAHTFLCPDLAAVCALRLDEMMDASTALETLAELRYVCARMPGAPSAPPMPDTEDELSLLFAATQRWAESIAHNALLVVDEHADEALTDERIEEFGYEELAVVVKRETLRMSSESVLVEALARWSVAACKRAKHELTPANRRAALGELAYYPRYLLLKGPELDTALAAELLDPIETALVRARAQGKVSPSPNVDQEAMLRRFSQCRPTSPAADPIYLSARTAPTAPCNRKKAKRKTSRDSSKEEGCCSCFGDGLLRAFICLFD